jgi:hypothetical protein
MSTPSYSTGEFAAKARSSFLKKRSKKLLIVWLRSLRIERAQIRKSFLVLFFKKELLSSQRLIRQAFSGLKMS